MRTPIIRTANPQRSARWQLGFALLYCPLFFTGMWLVMRHLGVLKGFEWMFFVCGIAISSIIICILVKLMAIKGQQAWKLIDGKLIYHSPSPLLGKSFEVPWDDVSKIYSVGDSDFARCDLVDGAYVEFHIGNRSGWEFFTVIKKMKAEQV